MSDAAFARLALRIDELTAEVHHLRGDVAALRQGSGQGVDPRRVRQAAEALFHSAGISFEGPAPGAESVQELSRRAGLAERELSQAILQTREE